MPSIASLVNPIERTSPTSSPKPLNPPPSQLNQLSSSTQSTHHNSQPNGLELADASNGDIIMGSEDPLMENDEEEDQENDQDNGYDDDDEEDMDAVEGLQQAEDDDEDDEDEDEEEEDEEEEDEEEDSDDDDAQSEDLEGDGPRSDAPLEPESSEAKTDGEGTGEAPGKATEGEEVVHKPLVKKKRARAASVDEMPPPPPPMLTIRVDREFEDDYETLEWNILDDARERGMVAEWPTGPDISNTPAEPEHPVAGPSQPPLPVPLDGNGLDANLMDDDALAIAARLEVKYGGPPKKRKTKKEEYDLADEFIDDSELAIDAPTHIGRTKKEGFFIQQGPVELIMEDVVVKRSGQKRSAKVVEPPPRLPTLIERVHAKRNAKKKAEGEGTRNSPIKLDDADELSPPQPEQIPVLDTSPEISLPLEHIPIDRSKYSFASNDPLTLPPFQAFPGPLAAALNELRQKSEEHTWLSEKRGHFPEHIKPYVFNVGKAAWEYDWWAAFPPKDDTHWKMLQYALPSCLPYNKLTLTKLMLQLCNSAYREWTAECEQVGLEALRAAAAEALPEFVAKREAQRQEYQAQLEAYESTQNANAANPPASNPVAPGSPQVDADAPAPIDGRPQPKRGSTMPAVVRDIYLQLLENNLQEIEFSVYGSSISSQIKQIADIKHRKALYEKVMRSLPQEMELTEKSLSTIMSRWKTRRMAEAGGPPGQA